MLKIACPVLATMLIEGREHHYLIKQGLPEDVRIINVRMGWGDYFELLLESEKFEEVPAFGEVPELAPIAIRTYPYGFKVVADIKECEQYG